MKAIFVQNISAVSQAGEYFLQPQMNFLFHFFFFFNKTNARKFPSYHYKPALEAILHKPTRRQKQNTNSRNFHGILELMIIDGKGTSG